MSRAKPDNAASHGDASRYSSANDNGYLGNVNSFGSQPLPKDEAVSYSAASEPSRLLDPRLEGPKKPMGSISALKEFVSSKNQCFYLLCLLLPFLVIEVFLVADFLCFSV